MEPRSQNFFQIFFHSSHAALHRAPDNALVHILFPGNLAVALAENQMRLYPDALHLWQRVEGIPQVDEQLHTIQKLLRRRLMQAGRVFDPIVTVEGILRLVAGRAPLMGCLIQLVRLQLGGHFVGNFDVFIMGVSSVKSFRLMVVICISSIRFMCGWVNRTEERRGSAAGAGCFRTNCPKVQAYKNARIA